MHTWGEVRNFACQKFGFIPDQDRTGLRTEILDWIGNANIFDPFNIRLSFSVFNLAAFPLSSEISDFTPCAHAQTNILHTRYADKSDY